MQVLIVEDELSVGRLVANRLEREGLTVSTLATVRDGIDAMRTTAFDVAILDITLPDGSGLDLLRCLQDQGATTHAIVLSGATSEADRVAALGLGADDYVVKPFFVRELTARVLAVRRRRGPDETILSFGAITVDVAGRSVTVAGREVALTAKEFDLLAFLAARPAQVFSRDALLRAVWQSAAEWQRPSTVTEHVRRVRAKIEPDPCHPEYLHTVRGVGYRFDLPSGVLAAHETNAVSASDADSTGGIVFVDGRIVWADEVAVELFGAVTATDLLGRELSDLVAPQSLIATRAHREATRSGLPQGSHVVAIRSADGSDTYVELSSVPTMWEGGPATLETIRLNPDSSARLRHLVTGVFSEVSDAVVITDPQFHVRSWNQAAEQLYGWPEHEVLGRHISDLVPFVDDRRGSEFVRQALEERGRCFGEGIQVARDGSPVSVSASTTLIRDDDGAPMLVVSVNRPSNRMSPRAPEESTELSDVARDIARGLSRHEFTVHYQPVMDLDDLRVVGVEALARWEHPDRGMLEPEAFIDVAEQSGLIVELGRSVFHEACVQAAAWRRDGFDIEVSINLSTKQLAAPALYDDILASLAESRLDPHSLWIEVTETALVEDLEQAAHLLHRLAALGIRVAIDDFGTGWASLVYLKQFPVHSLKIDQIFVDEVDTDLHDVAIARSIISLGAELEIAVVAEGVETIEQHSALQALGCALGQGFLFGRPTPASTVPTERAALL